MMRKFWILIGACLVVAAAGVAPVRADGECEDFDVASNGWSAAGVAVSVRASGGAPRLPTEPGTVSPLPAPMCDGSPSVAVSPYLEPGAPDDPCGATASEADAGVRATRGVNLHVSQPIGPACTVASTVPGPLVLNVYWNGSSTWQVEWTFTGSFTCTEVSGDAGHWQIDCVPDDPALYHCVNPGVEAVHSGADYTRTVVNLECGNIYGGCETPFEVGSCVAWLGGDQVDTIVCWGEYQVWVGPGSSSLPWQMHATCYSDPPQLPPGGVTVG